MARGWSQFLTYGERMEPKWSKMCILLESGAKMQHTSKSKHAFLSVGLEDGAKMTPTLYFLAFGSRMEPKWSHKLAKINQNRDQIQQNPHSKDVFFSIWLEDGATIKQNKAFLDLGYEDGAKMY